MRAAGSLRLFSGVAVAALVAGGGCVGWSMCSGKTLPKDMSSHTVGIATIDIEGESIGLPLYMYRYAPEERIDVGVSLPLGQLTFDLRYQLLVAESHGIDLSIQGGVGYLVIPIYFGGVQLSRSFGKVTPYAGYRYVGVDFDEISTGSTSTSLQQANVGLQIALGEKFALIPEFTWVKTDLDESTGFAMAFQFLKGTF